MAISSKSIDGTAVLIADDEDLLLNYVNLCLQRWGCRTTIANNGQSALEKFLDNPHTFDLVLTDYDMPRLNGEQLALRIRQSRPDLPVVLITGNPPSHIRGPEPTGPFCLVLNKPFTSAQLERSLRRALRDGLANRTGTKAAS